MVGAQHVLPGKGPVCPTRSPAFRPIASLQPARFRGNPTYNWDSMKKDGYVWWMARLRRSFKLYDRVRLDHFLGFQNYFGIPAGKTGADGRWLNGPGFDFFRRAYEEFGPLPFIAEDLGLLTPPFAHWSLRAASPVWTFSSSPITMFARRSAPIWTRSCTSQPMTRLRSRVL